MSGEGFRSTLLGGPTAVEPKMYLKGIEGN
jgi:hypothetical protein